MVIRFQVGAILRILLQGVDGNDGFVVVIKRIVIGGDAGADTLNADGVQSHQRNRKPAPHFLLKLGEHTLDSQNQNPFAAAPADQLADQNAAGQGFPKAHGIGDQNARPRLLQCLGGGIELVMHPIHGGLVSDIKMVVRGRRLPQQALHYKAGISGRNSMGR